MVGAGVLVVALAIVLLAEDRAGTGQDGSASTMTMTATPASTLSTISRTSSSSTPIGAIPPVSGSSTSSTGPTVAASTTVVLAQGAAYQVQSSFDCVAGHYEAPFNVTGPGASELRGSIKAGDPGVTLYIATAQSAQAVEQGHPSVFLYSSGLTNSTSFVVYIAPGSYVLWIEGADLNCGASIITPLEQITNVTVSEAFILTPV